MKKYSIGDVFGDLIDFDYNMYAQPNEYACSKCNKSLDGPVHVVSEEEDDEGHRWRTFCIDCWDELDSDDSEYTLQDLYDTYPAAPYIGEDDYIEEDRWMEEDQVESAITASRDGDIYRKIWDDVIGNRERFNTRLKRIQGLANAVVQYEYRGITEMEDAVPCALELLEAMTGQWYDPTQDEYDSLVRGEYTPY